MIYLIFFLKIKLMFFLFLFGYNNEIYFIFKKFIIFIKIYSIKLILIELNIFLFVNKKIQFFINLCKIILLVYNKFLIFSVKLHYS